MRTISTTKSHAIRLAADRLQAESTGQPQEAEGCRSSDAAEAVIGSAVDAARDGDQEALRFLYLRFAEDVFAYACSIVNDEHAAEDITQTVFSRLAPRLQRYKAGKTPFGAWIRHMAHNASIDYLRAQRSAPCEEIHDSDAFRDGAFRDDVSADRLDAIRQALGTLPQKQRQVLVMRFVLGMKTDEIGERLGRSELAVHTLQHKSRRRLRNELIHLGAAPMVRMAA